MYRLLLVLSPFISGAVVMALELVALRLLAPHFGMSTYVWGGLLGMILMSLAAGYLLGGFLADKRPDLAWVHGLLFGAALYLLGVLFAGNEVLFHTAELGISWGPAFATLLLIGPPMLLLGSVPPFVVALQARIQHIGTTTGQVLALSTLGSLVGTFLTAFWLLPSFGSRATLCFCIGVLFVTAAPGFASRWWGPPVLCFFGLQLFIPDEDQETSVIFRGESAYNTVIVTERNGVRHLWLNEHSSGAFQSIGTPGHGLTGLYYDLYYLGPILSGGREVLILGMAGGTMIHGYQRLFPDIQLTAVEIDPLVARVARDYFGIEKGPNLQVHIRDARPFLAETTKEYDVIAADLFAGGLEPPFYVLTQEFFALAQKRLRPNGVLIVNILDYNGDGSLAAPVSATMASIFPSVFEIPSGGNRILIGFRGSLSLDSIWTRLAQENTTDELRQVCRNAVESLRPIMPSDPDSIFMDDHAPIEQITHTMLKRIYEVKRRHR